MSNRRRLKPQRARKAAQAAAGVSESITLEEGECCPICVRLAKPEPLTFEEAVALMTADSHR